jgi:hypothetical protein
LPARHGLPFGEHDDDVGKPSDLVDRVAHIHDRNRELVAQRRST